MIAYWRRMMRPGLWAIGLVGLMVLGLAGCGDHKEGSVNRLTPRSKSYLDGVPVPSGFDLVDKMTEDHESGQQRTARHQYRGFGDEHAVRDFYREQMPLQGWSRVSDHNVKGIVDIRFERKGEACSIKIEPGWLNITNIQVIVEPFNRSLTEPPKRPLP